MHRLASNNHVVIALPVLQVGGTEIQTLNLTKALRSGGYQVSVCCYYEYDDLMVQEMRAAGVRTILMKRDRREGLLRLARSLIRLFKEIKPCIVHVQYLAPGLVPVLAARLSRVPVVFATVHQPGRPYGWKAKLFLRTAAKLCTAFFCNSRSVEKSWFGDSKLFDSFKSDRNRRHFTIYNGVDVKRIAEAIAGVERQNLLDALGIGHKAIVGTVGRLRQEKGQSILLDAIAAVIKVLPDAILLVVGDGPDRMSLEQRAKSLRVENNILWVGQKTPEEACRFYSVMDVVAVPSLFEGFGLSAAEAMAAGVPVVASAVDGLQEIVEQGVTGYLVPVNDSSALASRLIELLCNRESARSMGIQGQKRVSNLFSLDKFAYSICSAYERYVRAA